MGADGQRERRKDQAAPEADGGWLRARGLVSEGIQLLFPVASEAQLLVHLSSMTFPLYGELNGVMV